MNNNLYLKNATYIDPLTFEITRSHIEVQPGTDGKIKFIDRLPGDAKNILDVSGQIVTRSLVVGHHHIYSALAVGMPAPKKNPTNFYEILRYVWWTLDKALTKEMIEASALTTAIYAAKSGATFIIDHHASPNFIRGSLDIIANALDKAGLGHLLCYEITDRDGHDKALEGLEETADYLSRRQGLVGLHASFTVEEETMKLTAGVVEKYGSGVHIHVAEDRFDEDFATYRWGKRVVERLADYGFINNSKTILAHAIHINDQERMLLKLGKAWIVQNPESNLNNNVGFFSYQGLDRSRIMLGTDGMHSDMFRSAAAAYFAGLRTEPQDMLEIYARLRNNHKYLEQNGFKGDGENNLIVLDYQNRTPVTRENFIGHFFFGITARDVRHVISQGKIIVKDRQMTTIDEQAALEFAREQAKILWKKMSEI